MLNSTQKAFDIAQGSKSAQNLELEQKLNFSYVLKNY